MQLKAGAPIFYVTTYEDVDAIVNPRLKARGRRVFGPFSTYENATQHGVESGCSHFDIEKKFVGRDMDIPFLNEKEEDSG